VEVDLFRDKKGRSLFGRRRSCVGKNRKDPGTNSIEREYEDSWGVSKKGVCTGIDKVRLSGKTYSWQG